MHSTIDTQRFRAEAEAVLHENILPFWIRLADETRGGWYGAVRGDGTLLRDAPKGAVLHARILWAFSAAYRTTGRPAYLAQAARAEEYLLSRFYDRTYGGLYWSLAADGTPLDTKKQFYALGFAVYGLSEYARATGDAEALEYAVRLYRQIEAHSFDPVRDGYIEAAARDWSELEDVRLSAKDANERKTMNTHLHILEPYTNLYRVHRTEELRARLVHLIELFLGRIWSPSTGHLGLFFDDDWHSRDAGVSYGHDIEASWLLLEAAFEAGDAALTARVLDAAARIAAAAGEGLQSDGSLICERRANGTCDFERHWWVQAENVVGQLWLWRHHGDDTALARAAACWSYIRDCLVDSAGGEWWWGILSDGTPDRANDKAGFWKCPYHNTRMCLEAMELLE